jgi:Glyoxalase-like domain
MQLQGCYMELLTVRDHSKIPPHAAGRFSFGAFNAAYLAGREGMSMLALQTDDAEQDQRAFAAKGLDIYEPLHFSHKRSFRDGSEATVSYSVAFVTNPAMPEAAFFTCQHHAPHNFWRPEYQRHANGARSVAEVVMAANEPSGLVDFLGRLFDSKPVKGEAGSLQVLLRNGTITVLDAKGLAARYAQPDLGALDRPRFVGVAVAVEDADRVGSRLEAQGIPFRRTGDTIQVGPEDAFGVMLEFTVRS